MSELVTITIDGQDYKVPAGANLLQVCLDLGLMVPHFCYHVALGPAGSCRLCAAMVASAKDKPARLEMTCMARVADGMVVSINDPYAKDFRRGVIEYLMLNHPHDCPVCDEGGECMLQDMTVLSEHIHRRNRFPKRTWRNQYLGPLIHHEMNRCITCYRCVRFYRDYALGKDLGVFGSRDRVYFGRVKDGVLESEFAGNLVDVCPTGVFTNKRFREVYARPWDLQTARSVCVHCSVGCNLLPGGRHRTLRRVKPAPHKEINRFFICDRGRYGPEYVNTVLGTSSPIAGGKNVRWDEAFDEVASRLRDIVAKHGPQSVLGVGSGHTSLEANAALLLLLKAVGAEPLIVVADDDAQHAAVQFAAAATVSRKVPVPSLVQIEKCDVILNIGGDLTAEAPMIDLSIRQALRAGGKYFALTPRPGKLEEFAANVLRVRPDALPQAVRKIASGLTDKQDTISPEIADIVQALAAAKKPFISCSACRGSVETLEATWQLAQQLHTEARPCYLAYYLPEANSTGVGLLRHSIAPSLALERLARGEIKAIVSVERDLTALFSSIDEAQAQLKSCELLVGIESVPTPLAESTHVWFPALPHYLTQGKFVNYEGRAQHSDGLHLAQPLTWSATDILIELVEKLGKSDLLAAAKYSDVYAIAAANDEALDNLTAENDGVLINGVEAPAKPSGTGAPPTWKDLTPWRIIYHFGSEPLSALSPPVAELAPKPCVEIHPEDGKRLGITEGAEVELPGKPGQSWVVRYNKNLALGTYAMSQLYTLSPSSVNAEVKA